MDKKTYAEKLRHPKWQEKRLRIFERDGFQCVYCKDKETTLHVHHKKYHGNPWECENDYLVTLCEMCHDVVEMIKGTGAEFLDIIPLMTPKDGHRKFVTILRTKDGRLCASFMQHNIEHGSCVVVESTELDNIYETIQRYRQ